jgi:glycosyltransferase involved in cell wall biosynthesis
MLIAPVLNPMSTQNPLISVVMPCYNAAPYLTDAVESALRQSYRNVELILVDDGSTDASTAIAAGLAEQYSGRITLLHATRTGPYPARNMGLQRARGDFVAFLDADDWWESAALEKLHAGMVGAGADIGYCGWRNVGEGVTSEPYVPPPYEQADAIEAFLRTTPWPIHAALVKRAIVDQLDGFSVRRFSSMDYDFWLRALTITRNIVRVPEVLAFYRWHGPHQVSAVKWRQVLDALAVQQDFIRANPQLVAHLPVRRVRDLTEGQVLRQAYRALWKRDIVSAHKLFRHVALARSFGFKELRHVASAMLPLSAYRWLVDLADRNEP